MLSNLVTFTSHNTADVMLQTRCYFLNEVLSLQSASFVEERRRRLQRYLRKIINMLLENGSDLMHNPSRKTLEALLPFFQ